VWRLHVFQLSSTLNEKWRHVDTCGYKTGNTFLPYNHISLYFSPTVLSVDITEWSPFSDKHRSFCSLLPACLPLRMWRHFSAHCSPTYENIVYCFLKFASSSIPHPFRLKNISCFGTSGWLNLGKQRKLKEDRNHRYGFVSLFPHLAFLSCW
jgi:hypothetical protein